MSDIRWRSKGDLATEKCIMCKQACVPKDVGNICVTCLEAIPRHIPNEQTHRYLGIKKPK